MKRAIHRELVQAHEMMQEAGFILLSTTELMDRRDDLVAEANAAQERGVTRWDITFDIAAIDTELSRRTRRDI